MTSANIVGYKNTEVRNGSKMVGASFATIGEKNGIYLSQLAPVGYEGVSVFTDTKKGDGGVKGQFKIKILTSTGGQAYDEKTGVAKTWSYFRTYPKATKTWSNDGCWKDENGTVMTGEKDVFFANGQGLWFDVAAGAYKSGTEKYSLNNAGEAILDANSVLLRNGSTGVAIPLSASVKLSQIKPTGYENVSVFTDTKKGDGGVKGQFKIKILTSTGGQAYDEKTGVAKTWSYFRTYPKATKTWSNDGCWKDENGTVMTDENDITFESGDGLWVDVAAGAYKSGEEKYYLSFPGIDDTPAAE